MHLPQVVKRSHSLIPAPRKARVGLALLVGVCGLIAAVVALAVVLTASTASAAPTSQTSTGTCTGCTSVFDPLTGCDRILCTDPDFPSCLTDTPGAQTCTPGSTSTTQRCTGTGVGSVLENCTYTCNAGGTGYGDPVCLPAGTYGGDLERTYCDFNAGCPAGERGALLGKPTTVRTHCSALGVSQTIEQGACGAGGCVREPACQPGRPCPYCTPGVTTRECGGQVEVCPDDGIFPPCGRCEPGDEYICPDGSVSQCNNGHYLPCGECIPGEPIYCSGGGVRQCSPDGTAPECPPPCPPGQCPEVCEELPKCRPDPSGQWVCSWNDVDIVAVQTPCPIVQRNPWPRGLVGVPNRFEITGGCGEAPTASNSVSINPPTCDRRTIIGYRATLTWVCSDPSFANARWTMDERSWNVGHASADIQSPVDGRPVSQSMLNGDLTIHDQRQGRTVTHIYETSSYDKPSNGPGYPNASQRQPGYQVRLRTTWTLVGNFQYQQRETVERCYDNSTPPQPVGCPPPREWCDAHSGDPNCRDDINIRVTEIISPWHPGPVIQIPDIAVEGALTPQDAGQPLACGAISTPILQSQAVLKP